MCGDRTDAHRLPCQAGVTEDPVTGCAVKPSDTPNPTLDEQLVLDGNVNLSARVSLSDMVTGDRSRGRISLWGRNLLDNDEYEFLFPVIGGQALGTFQDPLTYGIDFTLEFN